MTRQRFGAVTTAVSALVGSVVSLLVILGVWHLDATQVAGIALVTTNTAAVVGTFVVTPPDVHATNAGPGAAV